MFTDACSASAACTLERRAQATEPHGAVQPCAPPLNRPTTGPCASSTRMRRQAQPWNDRGAHPRARRQAPRRTPRACASSTWARAAWTGWRARCASGCGATTASSAASLSCCPPSGRAARWCLPATRAPTLWTTRRALAAAAAHCYKTVGLSGGSVSASNMSVGAASSTASPDSVPVTRMGSLASGNAQCWPADRLASRVPCRQRCPCGAPALQCARRVNALDLSGILTGSVPT